MIEFLLTLLRESPVLFVIFLINAIVVTYIVSRILLYVYKKKRPERLISLFIWKLKTKRKKKESKTIDDACGQVMDSLRKEGILDKNDKNGFKSREKALNKLEGEKKEIVLKIFSLYEKKIYGNRRITNEDKVVSELLSNYLNL